MHYFLKFIFGMKLYMFQTVPLSIIGSPPPLYTQQCYTSHRFADSLQADQDGTQFHPDPAHSCQQTCMTYNIAVCTVKNS